MMVYCAILMSTHDIPFFNIKKENHPKLNHPKLSQNCNYGICSKRPMNEFETAVVNEPSVLEPLRGWSGGAMVLGKLPGPGHPTIWISVGQGPTALAVGAGLGFLDIFTLIYPPGHVAQSVGHLTRKSGVLGSIPGLVTYLRFSFRFFKKGSCQLLAKVCARSTG